MRFLSAVLLLASLAFADDADEARHAFAREMLAAVRKLGVADAAYVPDDFALARKDAVLNLDRAFLLYRDAEGEEKAAVIDRFARLFAGKVEFDPAWAKVKDRILPVVRPRFVFSAVTPEQEIMRLPSIDLGGGYSLALAEDRPETIRYLSAEQLESWKLSFEQALAQARRNLEAANGKFTKFEDGIYFADWEDGYNPSRLLLTDAIAKLRVQGDPVAFVPSRTELVITGSKDARGLGFGVELLLERRGEADAMEGVVLRLDRGTRTWRRFLPEQPEDVARALRQFDLIERRDAAARQKAVLDVELKDQDVFVTPLHVFRNAKGDMLSVASWTKGATSLLPRADEITFVDLTKAEGKQVVAVAAWADVLAECPKLLVASKKYAGRFRTEGFPSAEQLKRLAASPREK